MTKILFLFFFSTSLLAFEHEPKLTGNISISIKNGTIDANLQLENIPPINDYLIFLNSGFNIQYFRDHSDSVNYTSKKEYNANFASESFGYYFLDKNSNNKILPPSIKFKYTGKFPVIDSMDKASDYSDWKGNIAFNGKRALLAILSSMYKYGQLQHHVFFKLDKSKHQNKNKQLT
jgi:hypothetical protein